MLLLRSLTNALAQVTALLGVAWMIVGYSTLAEWWISQ